MEEDLDALIDDLPAYDVIGSSGVVAPRIVSDCSLDGLQEEKIKLGEFVMRVFSTYHILCNRYSLQFAHILCSYLDMNRKHIIA